MDFLDRLAEAAISVEARYVSRMMSHPFVRASLEAGLPAYWWDPLAAVALVPMRDSIIDYTKARIDIIEDGPSAGRTAAVRAPSGTKLRLAVAADGVAFEEHFLAVLNGDE